MRRAIERTQTWTVAQAEVERRVKLGRLKGNYFAGAGYLTGTRVLGLPSMSSQHASLWASDPLRSLIREVATRELAAPSSLRGGAPAPILPVRTLEFLPVRACPQGSMERSERPRRGDVEVPGSAASRCAHPTASGPASDSVPSDARPGG